MVLSDTKKPFRRARKGCRDGRLVVVRSDYGAAQVRGRWALYGRAKLLAKAAVGVRSVAAITKPMRMLCSSRDVRQPSSRVQARARRFDSSSPIP